MRLVIMRNPGLWQLLVPYRKQVFLLVLLAMAGNGAHLVLPRLVGMGINRYAVDHRVPLDLTGDFAATCLILWTFSALQTLVQVSTAERVARDLRSRLAEKISRQSFRFVQAMQPSRLLTNLTSDVDAVKTFVSDVIAGLLSSVLILVGATLMLLSMNWRLALAVMAVVPGIGLVFALVLRRVRPYFKETREVLDRLNKVINESVLGAALIRVVDGARAECGQFEQVNDRARQVGLIILRKFALMIPVVNLMAQLASVIILAQGGTYVIGGGMTVGDLATFNGYLAIVIFPIFVIGFMNNLIAQAQAAFTRLQDVLEAPAAEAGAQIQAEIAGAIEVCDLGLDFGEKHALKNVSFEVRPGTRTAILGPTAAGKTQLLYLLMGLLKPTSGQILLDGRPVADYAKRSFHRQVAMVFQESILFHMSVRDNVAFAQEVEEAAWSLAVDTAELSAFLENLPDGDRTVVSERGTSLSGGQKQRLMLARALALRPKVLLLDDFTARVDGPTERKILANLKHNYPGLTLLAVTQRISTIQDYDHIILLMEGEVVAQGTHQQLLVGSPEYQQIFESQKSTQEYELPAE
ncbi:MAG: ABC transporter ATP-binding protein [Candidatus Eremiobacteraeota bacterium]|nr:ABC transporter ATP-binding protein [Candidatus Eremiobacteraeota bacterium]MCW5869742.1 ABC transporter ATP-binding protein [Candidatus Eremiobacteraeota bacterium]